MICDIRHIAYVIIKTMVILGFDGLEPSLVEKWQLKELRQNYRGKTDLSEFKLLRTVALWSSFLTGRNMEDEIKNDNLWDFQLKLEETFLSKFQSPVAIDVPAVSYKQEGHKNERALLRSFFESSTSEEEKKIINEYDQVCWENHKEVKKEFFEALNSKSDLVFGYFALTDTIAHLSFSDEEKTKRTYLEAEEITQKTKEIRPKDNCIIISDHGMKLTGGFGDHAPEGFYSSNFETGLSYPKITDFFNLF